jgi:hypothetical protein
MGVIPKERINQLPVFVSTTDDSMVMIAKQVKVIIWMCMCIEITTPLLPIMV